MDILIIAASVLAVVTQSPEWSRKSFEAAIQETIVQPDGEIRLLVLLPDIEFMVPEDDSIRLLSQFIERMFLGELSGASGLS